ncbi:MAG: lycopene cyclase domain-containing protein [Chloroflexota bacterium]
MMTYFAFLALFLGIPLFLVGWLAGYDHRRRRWLPDSLRAIPARWALLAHVAVAVLYTTPWDNYLVATGVWWYPPERVIGLRLGWVPIEEYTFFVLQSLLAGLWLLWLVRRLPVDTRPNPFAGRARWGVSAILAGVWVVVLVLFLRGPQFTYLGLILLWAIPPILLQLAVGVDVLWRYRAAVGVALLSLTLYLAAADFLAIADEIWTIDPAQSLQIYLLGVLPFEEFLFFLVTNTLIVFGVVLVLSRYTWERARAWLSFLTPAAYHGTGQRPPFFEGWYFKLISADETRKLAVIPGVFLGEEGHAFVQVLDGGAARSAYVSLPLAEFEATPGRFDFRAGPNRFSADGISLDLSAPDVQVHGQIQFGPLNPWPVTWLSPGVMGWYAWVPRMECYHGVLSFDHSLRGQLVVDGDVWDFDGGHGYVEKDWGQAFPDAYIWFQSNHFGVPHACLTGSVAIIPWLGGAFRGFIVGLWLNGRLYRFATYSGAKVEALSVRSDRVEWVLHDRHYRLEIVARRADSAPLKGPSRQDMGRRIDETLSAILETRLSTLQGETVFEATGRHAGLEVHGDLQRLEAAR